MTEPAMDSRQKSLDRGRIMVLICATLMVAVALMASAITGAAVPGSLPANLARSAITALLAWKMYRRASWARWLTVILAAQGGLMGVLNALALAPRTHAMYVIVLGALPALYLALASVLAVAPPVNEYFKEPTISLVESREPDDLR